MFASRQKSTEDKLI